MYLYLYTYIYIWVSPPNASPHICSIYTVSALRGMWDKMGAIPEHNKHYYYNAFLVYCGAKLRFLLV